MPTTAFLLINENNEINETKFNSKYVECYFITTILKFTNLLKKLLINIKIIIRIIIRLN